CVVEPDVVRFFFFSSRRRHTSSYGDWSSDVCSSDLPDAPAVVVRQTSTAGSTTLRSRPSIRVVLYAFSQGVRVAITGTSCHGARSEERRVGKEWRSRGAPEHEEEQESDKR